jgi:HNH endonuclease
MATRKKISNSVRFEVFKRDSFCCTYCGKKAPDVLLEVDHIEPVSKGGTNDMLNLITSCKECNSGKSATRLRDSTVIDKQHDQLAELQKRKEQIEMMFKWKKGLVAIDDDVLGNLTSFWSDLIPGFSLNANGELELRKLRRRFSIEEIMDAMMISKEQYLVFKDGQATQESVEVTWQKIGGICTIRQKDKDLPYASDLYYVRGILRNRLHYVNENEVMSLLRRAAALDASMDSLKDHAKATSSWTSWKDGIERFIEKQSESGEIGD